MYKDIVVYDLFAKWCGPCRLISPFIDQLAQEYPGIKFIKLDMEANNPGHPNFDVRSVPCIVVFVNDIEVARKFGFQSKDQIKKMFEPYL